MRLDEVDRWNRRRGVLGDGGGGALGTRDGMLIIESVNGLPCVSREGETVVTGKDDGGVNAVGPVVRRC